MKNRLGLVGLVALALALACGGSVQNNSGDGVANCFVTCSDGEGDPHESCEDSPRDCQDLCNSICADDGCFEAEFRAGELCRNV